MTVTNAALYGKGVFTTVAVFKSTPLFWDKHWLRLITNAEKIGIDLTEFPQELVFGRLTTALRSITHSKVRARITFFDERSADLWVSESPSGLRTNLSINTAERRKIKHGLKLISSAYSINSNSPLAGIKSCNYLEPIMSLDEAKVRGFHEAIRVNERGFVTSACMANVFWIKGGQLFTPGLATGCLAGTTREFVLENIDCREVEVGIEALKDADAIFLTSAGIGVVQVVAFEERRFEKVDHPILHLLPY